MSYDVKNMLRAPGLWKLPIFDENEDGEIIFTTAMNEPKKVIRELVERYPMLNFEHWWSEEEPGHYCGYREYINGIEHNFQYDDESQEALETFEKIWGNTGCVVYEEGCWRRRDCAECEGCG